MKKHFNKKLFVGAFVIGFALLCAGAAVAWTGPLSSPPTCTSGNPGCDAPLNIANSSQVKAGGSLTISGGGSLGATSFCLPGSNPTGGCITTWPSSGTSVWTTGGRGSSFNYNTWPSATAEAGSDRWIDGGSGSSANSNGPIYGGNTTGTLMQFDPLYNSQPDAFKLQILDPYAGGSPGGDTLYWRDQYSSTWNNWLSFITASPSGQATVPGFLSVGTSSASNGIIQSIGSNAGFQTYDRSGNGNYSIFYRNGNNSCLWDNSVDNVLCYNSSGQVSIGVNGAVGEFVVEANGRAITGTSEGGGDWSGCFGSDCTGGTQTVYGVYGNGTTAAGEFNGPVIVTGNVTANAYYYNSDERLKDNIQTIATSTALADVLGLNPVTFDWKNQSTGSGTQIGFIAQQVQSVVPQIVATNASTTMESVDYARVTPLLVGATQAQQQQIQTLEGQVQTQQQEIDQLTAEVQALEAK